MCAHTHASRQGKTDRASCNKKFPVSFHLSFTRSGRSGLAPCPGSLFSFFTPLHSAISFLLGSPTSPLLTLVCWLSVSTCSRDFERVVTHARMARAPWRRLDAASNAARSRSLFFSTSCSRDTSARPNMLKLFVSAFLAKRKQTRSQEGSSVPSR